MSESGDPQGSEFVDPFDKESTENPEPEEQRPVPKGVFIPTPDAVGSGEPQASELPRDIEAIWGHSTEDRATARTLIDTWGLEAFRGSQIHLAAVQEAKGAKQRALNQKAFLDAQKRLKK